MTTEKLVRVDDVVFFLRGVAGHVMEEAEEDAGTLTPGELEQIVACAFTLNECAQNVHLLHAANAVEVVRCKDCKRRGASYECPFRHLMHTEGKGYHYVDMTTDAGYCSFGEKKEAEA